MNFSSLSSRSSRCKSCCLLCCLVCVSVLASCCSTHVTAASVDVVRFTMEGDLLSPTNSTDQPGALFDAAALETLMSDVAVVAGVPPQLVGLGVVVAEDEDASHHDDHHDHAEHSDHHGDDHDDDHDVQPGSPEHDEKNSESHANKLTKRKFYVDLALFSTDSDDSDGNTHQSDTSDSDDHTDEHDDHDHDHRDHHDSETHPVVQHYSNLVVTSQTASESSVVVADPYRLASFPLSKVELMTPTVDDVHHDEHDEKPSKGEAWLYSMLAMAILSAISLSGAVALVKGQHFIGCVLTEMLALGAGSMLGAAFFLLLPEAQHTIGWDPRVGLACLGGAMFGCLGEKAGHLYSRDMRVDDDPSLERHTHGRGLQHHVEEDRLVPGSEKNKTASAQSKATTAIVESGTVIGDVEAGVVAIPETSPPSPILPLAYASIIGDCVCNFVDGALLGAVFLTSTRTGWATALSIFLHELPQEMGDFGIFIHAGYTPMGALALNLLVSLSALFGCLLSLIVGADFEEQIYYLLPIGAGVFIYISMACIIPELMKVHDFKKNMRVFFCLFLGMGLMALMLLIPHEHGSHDDHNH